MCGRFTLRSPAGVIVAQFGLRELAELAARYNIAPTQQVLAIRADDASRAWQPVWLRWGLIPSWAKDEKIGAQLMNARSETIAEKPSFRAAFKQRRCLIVADGFYEWQKSGRAKLPFHIRRRDQQPFAFAGLWERWRGGDGLVESCTIITTAANDLLRPLHERMPVILAPPDYGTWLAPTAKPEELQPLLASIDTPELEIVPANPIVNSARHDSPDCLQPPAELF
ncbi:MAG: SOS response-associated peptidase [Planctomycetia bacterium]|nr:SOS response-associated peptidase [Planctomycetia bacterium]